MTNSQLVFNLDGYSTYFGALNVRRQVMLFNDQSWIQLNFVIFCKKEFNYLSRLQEIAQVKLIAKDANLSYSKKSNAYEEKITSTLFEVSVNFSFLGWIGITSSRSDNPSYNSLSITMYVLDKHKEEGLKLIDKLRENENFVEKLVDEKGTIYMMVQRSGELDLVPIGSDYLALERDNYAPKAIEQYDYIVQEFSKKTPNGFISIFSGFAGTGKTHMLRSLLGEIKNAMFVFVPPAMIANLVSPSFLPTFITIADDLKRSNDNLIFVLEDADEVLAPRMVDNIHTISTLLNMTDGMIGRLFNLRIIATTNQKTEAFDDAIMRPGRLCAHVKVDKLSPEQSMSVYKRLTGADHPAECKSPHSLAAVYHMATGFKQTNEHQSWLENKKTGF